jgi:hypothetical protein
MSATVQAQDVVQTSPAAGAKVETPPFWVVGVVITSTQRSAVLVTLDDAHREVGVTTVREGESLGGYRLAAVEPDRVLLEQRGTQVAVPVGRPYEGSKHAPDASRRKGLAPIFIPAPHRITPEIPYVGPRANRDIRSNTSADSGSAPMDPATQDIFQRLLESPQFQQTIEERRPILQQHLDRIRQDNQAPPDSIAPSARKREGASQ